MSSLVKYGSFEIEAAEDEKSELDAMGGGAFLKLEAGRNVVRFLPPKLGMRSPFVKVQQHFMEIPGAQKSAVFNCPRMENRRCAGCVQVDTLRATGNPIDNDKAGKWAAKLRVYANVISRKNPEMGPQVIAFGKMIYEKLLALRQDEDAGGDFTHPDEGFDIIISKTGEKMNTKYDVTPARASSPLGDVEWIEIQRDIRPLTNVPTDDQIDEMLQQIIGAARGTAGARRQAAQVSATTGRGTGAAPRGTPASTAVTPRAARGKARTAEDDALETEDTGG